MQEFDKAMATYEEGLKHDPDSSELKEGLMRCIQGINKVGCMGRKLQICKVSQGYK